MKYATLVAQNQKLLMFELCGGFCLAYTLRKPAG